MIKRLKRHCYLCCSQQLVQIVMLATALIVTSTAEGVGKIHRLGAPAAAAAAAAAPKSINNLALFEGGEGVPLIPDLDGDARPDLGADGGGGGGDGAGARQKQKENLAGIDLGKGAKLVAVEAEEKEKDKDVMMKKKNKKAQEVKEERGKMDEDGNEDGKDRDGGGVGGGGGGDGGGGDGAGRGETPIGALISEEEAPSDEDAEATEFGNQRVNFRFQRMMKALDSQHGKINLLMRQRLRYINGTQRMTSEERAVKTSVLLDGWRRVNQTFTAYDKQTKALQQALDRNYSSVEEILRWDTAESAVETRKKIEELQIEVMRKHLELERLEKNARQLDEIEAAKREENARLQQEEEAQRHLVSGNGGGGSRGSRDGSGAAASDGRGGVFDKVEAELQKVDAAANDLQHFLNDGAFDKAQWRMDASLQTVVKFYGKAHGSGGHKSKGYVPASAESKKALMSWLVDADNNQYVLTKPADRTNQPQDELLLFDLMIVLGGCWVLGVVASHAGLPAFIGHLVAGILLGPSGVNAVTNMVQLQTLGEVGIFLLLFVLGLEFSMPKLRSIYQVAVVGGTAITLSVFFVTFTLGALLSRPLAESTVVAFVMALSSTTVAANNLRAAEQDRFYGQNLLGVLIIQDVYVGVIMALLPLITDASGGSSGNNGSADNDAFSVVSQLGNLVLAFLLLGLVLFLLTRLGLRRLLRELQKQDNASKLLGGTVFCFAFSALTERLGISSELGCFAAGVVLNFVEAKGSGGANGGGSNSGINGGSSGGGGGGGDGGVGTSSTNSSGGGSIVRGIEHAVRPIQEFFLVIFFAAVGMHVYPTFLMENFTLLLGLTVTVLAVKYACSMAVFFLLHGNNSLRSSHVTSVGLAQVSEFGFVLAARGKATGALPHSIYFLTISVTGITLLLAPLLWRYTKRSRRHLEHGRSATLL